MGRIPLKKVKGYINPIYALIKEINAELAAKIKTSQKDIDFQNLSPDTIREQIKRNEESQDIYLNPRLMQTLFKAYEYNDVASKIGLSEFVRKSSSAFTINNKMLIENFARGSKNVRLKDTVVSKVNKTTFTIQKKSTFDNLPQAKKIEKPTIVICWPQGGENPDEVPVSNEVNLTGIRYVKIENDPSKTVSSALLTRQQLQDYKDGKVVTITVEEGVEITGLAPVEGEDTGALGKLFAFGWGFGRFWIEICSHYWSFP